MSLSSLGTSMGGPTTVLPPEEGVDNFLKRQEEITNAIQKKLLKASGPNDPYDSDNDYDSDPNRYDSDNDYDYDNDYDSDPNRYDSDNDYDPDRDRY